MKRYKVTAPSRVLDHEPGTEFNASINPDQEAFLLEIKALKVVEEKRAEKRYEPSKHR